MNNADIEKILRFRGITIRHPRMNAVFEKFDYLRQMSRNMQKIGPEERLEQPSLNVLPMIAPTGSGKTKIIETYIKKVSSEERPGRTTPVLYVNLSTNLTVKGFYADVLKSFGDPNFAKGTQQHLEKKMQTFVCARGVELLVIDEVHHLMSAETHKVKWDVAELFKNILNNKTCCLVLSGIEKASFLFEDGSQLARRSIEPVSLDPLDARCDGDRDLFSGFILRMDKEMDERNVTEGPSGLLNGDVPPCIFEVSGGRIGIAWHLLERALMACLERGGKRIEWDDLSRATDAWAIPSGFAKRNPFRLSRVNK